MSNSTSKRLRLYFGISGCCALIFLVLAIVFPIVIQKLLNQKARDNVIMTKSNYNQWGLIPGDTNITITRSFYFYNFTNPDEVLYQGKAPNFTETGPYIFQEYQNFTNPQYYDLNGTNLNLVQYNQWIYMKELSGGKNITDVVNAVNFAPLGAWYQVKTSDPAAGQLPLQAIGQLIIGLEQQIQIQALSQGVQALFLNTSEMITSFLSNIITNQTQLNVVSQDSQYGFNTTSSLSVWVQGVLDGLNSSNTRLLRQYFNLPVDQMMKIYNKLNSSITSINELLSNNYCKQNFTMQMECGPRLLTALQWSSQGLTLNPPGGVSPTPSILSGNTTAIGYPEISYYLKEYFLKNVVSPNDPDYSNYQSVTFSTEWAYNFLKRGNATNWATDQNILLHVGNMQFIYQQGMQFDQNKTNQQPLQNLVSRFNLNNVYQARVLWEYIKYIVNEFAIQTSIGGNKETLGFGALGSQGFYQSYSLIKNTLYDKLVNEMIQAQIQDTSCVSFFNNSIDGLNNTQLNSLCNNQLINASNFSSVQTIQFLRNACDLVQQSAEFIMLQKLGSLTNFQGMQLCDLTQGKQISFQQLLNSSQLSLKQQYGCYAQRLFCSKDEIANLQWGQSAITQNPPKLLANKYMKSLTLNDWDNQTYPTLVEFSAIQSRKYNQSLVMNLSQTQKYLTFNSLFSAPVLSSILINYQKNNIDYFTKNFPDLNIDGLLNYLRYVILNNVFFGFIQTRSVSDLLLGYDDPFLTMFKQIDPAMGGNPYIPNNINLGQNVTYEQSQQMQRVMYTGVGDYTKVRSYYSAFGLRNISVPTVSFNGNTSDLLFVNPYRQQVPILGNDGAFGHPNIDSDDVTENYVYVDILYRSCGTIKNGQKQTYSGIDTERFVIPSTLMASNQTQPGNDVFYQDKYDGFLNFTSIQQVPIFNSKKHYLDANVSLVNKTLVYDNTGKLIQPSRENDETYLDVEPYTGASVSLYLKLQTSYLLQQDSLLNYKSVNGSTDYMLPLFSLDRGGTISDKFLSDNFGPIKTALKIRLAAQVAGYALFGIFFILAGVFLYKFKKQSKSEEEEGLLSKN